VWKKVNSVCAEGLCDLYGVFDNTSSSSCVWVSDSYYDELIDHGFGSYMNDTICAGGHEFPNMEFGVVERYAASYPITTPQTAIFGMGAFCETTACDTYNTFLQLLYDKGFISRRAFSIYLGPNDPNAEGVLLIGGIDKAKRTGPVYTRKVLDPTNATANQQPNYVPLQSVELRLANGTNTTETTPNDTYVLWDTGTPGWYMPQNTFNQVMEVFGLSPNAQADASGYYTVDCAFRNPTDDVLVVNMGGDADIEVPLYHLVSELGDNRCAVSIAPYGGIHGDAFLRDVYFTFDYDELTVEFSAVKYTEETDIVKIM
jgi:hypothetical protein